MREGPLRRADSTYIRPLKLIFITFSARRDRRRSDPDDLLYIYGPRRIQTTLVRMNLWCCIYLRRAYVIYKEQGSRRGHRTPNQFGHFNLFKVF